MKSVDRRQAALLALLVVVVAVWALWPKGGGRAGSSAPEAPRQAARGAVRVASELPSLEDLKAERGELTAAVHRNVFRFYNTPTPVPPTPRPTATPVPVQGSGSFIGPLQPTPTPTATPIVPPPVPYKAVGVFGPRDQMIAALEEGSRLIGAREGDVLDGKFILKKINLESIDFAFVGLPPEITRRIPIAGVAPDAKGRK
jgi:hypothetical protein